MKLVVSSFALSFLVLLSACGDSSGGGPKHFKVAVIPKQTTSDFWKAVEVGARKADAELADLEIVWNGPATEGDAAAQLAIVQSSIADRCDGICLAPLDAQALEAPLKTALLNKIPVVIFDSPLARKDLAIASFVATDNFHGGQLAGEEMVRLLDGFGNLVILRHRVGDESTEQRELGFLDAVTRHPNMRVLSHERYGGADEATAAEVSASLLSKYGEKVGGIFCSSEMCTSGMLAALRREPRLPAGKIKLVGFDSSQNVVDALKDGTLNATVLQDPVMMGYRTVMAMHDKLAGKEVKARIATGETLATKENMESEHVRALFFPVGAR